MAVVSNLSKDVTKQGLRHFLRGTMVRKQLCKIGEEPTISKITFLTIDDLEEGSQVDASLYTKIALVDFASSEACHTAVQMVGSDDIVFHGKRLTIEKLTCNFHVDHAERNDAIRNSINKRNDLEKHRTNDSNVDNTLEEHNGQIRLGFVGDGTSGLETDAKC